MSALKKQRNKASVAQPPEQTPFAQLHSWMSSGVVTKVYLEALGNASTRPADPTKAGMGKKKNHWALRFMIQHPFEYIGFKGVPKQCFSVRVSVEPPTDGYKCTNLTLKAMANTEQMSHSAIADFEFELLRFDRTLKDFLELAAPLLPFYYIVVAKSLTPAAPGAAGSGPRGRRGDSQPQLNEHLNGCRDFTAQWFIKLHEAGYVNWQAIRIQHPPSGKEPKEEEFHKIIGYRYSASRLDPSKIAMATFPRSFQRKLVADVNLTWAPATGESAAGRQRVKLPYQTQPDPVQTFNNTGGSSGGSGHR